MPNQVHGVLLHAMYDSRAVPRNEPHLTDCEYSQPFRHIQYNLIAIRRPMATLAMLLCRRIAGEHTGVSSPAGYALLLGLLPPNKKRNKELPCLLMCPNRCFPGTGVLTRNHPHVRADLLAALKPCGKSR